MSLAASGVAGAVLGVALAAWPFFTLAILLAVALGATAWRSPEHAFLASVLLFSTEGWWKAMLSQHGTPLPVEGNVVGAAFLDACLLVSVLALARVGAVARLRERWRESPQGMQLALALFLAWIVVSAAQAMLVGSLSEGVHGLRLVQAYAVLCLAGALLLPRAFHARAVSLVLAGGLATSLYAIVAFVFGPQSVLRGHTLNEAGIETFGGVVRASGTFSAALGLATYLAPVAVVGLAAALLARRGRLIATTCASTASAAVVLAFVRSGTVAIATGFCMTAVLAFVQLRSEPRGPRWRVVCLAALAGAVLVLGTSLASRVSADAQTRNEGLVRPLADESVQLRLDTWRETMRVLAAHPFGTGIGSVGAASARAGADPSGPTAGSGGTTIADNSYLKILREQGAFGVLFVLGLGAAFLSLLHGLWRERAGPAAVASTLGSASFFVLAAATEAIEQPGKVLAWTLLGIALAGVWATGTEQRPVATSKRRAPAGPLALRPIPVAPWLVVAGVAAATTLVLSAARDDGFTTQLTLDTKTAVEAEQLASRTESVVAGPAAFRVVTGAGALLALEDLPARVRAEPVGSAVRLQIHGATPGESGRLASQLLDLLSGGTMAFSVRQAAEAEVTRAVDRALSGLPGSFPARVAPAWSPVFAGVATALLLLSALHGPRPRRRTGAREGAERPRVR